MATKVAQPPEPNEDPKLVTIDYRHDGVFTMRLPWDERTREGTLAEMVEAVRPLKRTRYLTVYASHRSLTREHFREIAKLRQLEDIFVETYARVSGPELQPLLKMPRLREIEFKESTIEPGVVTTLSKSRSLRALRVPQAVESLEAEAARLNVRFTLGGTGNYEP